MVVTKKEKRRRHQEFLSGFFSNEPKNDHLELNGFVLFKHWDGNGKKWRVDLFTKESFKTMVRTDDIKF